MFSNEAQKGKKSKSVIRSLVYGYPAHGFAICYDEAKKIGLMVSQSSDYPDWEGVWEFINKLIVTHREDKLLWHLTNEQFLPWSK